MSDTAELLYACKHEHTGYAHDRKVRYLECLLYGNMRDLVQN